MQTSVLTEILEDDLVSTPGENEMAELSQLVQAMQVKMAKAEMVEKELAILNKEIRTLSEVKIPEKFLQMKIQSLTMENGAKVTINQVYAANLGDRAPVAFEWLRDHGLDDIIKHEVKMNFGQGEEDSAQAVVHALRQAGYFVEDKETIHPQTLKAFVKEQIEMGNTEFPMETFGVHIINRTKIKGGK